MEKKRVTYFPNGFSDWHETHFEMVEHIVSSVHLSGSAANIKQAEQGHGGLYELAEDWTNEFEKKYQGQFWDGEYRDTIEAFIKEKEFNTKHT